MKISKSAVFIQFVYIYIYIKILTVQSSKYLNNLTGQIQIIHTRCADFSNIYIQSWRMQIQYMHWSLHLLTIVLWVYNKIFISHLKMFYSKLETAQ